MQAFGTLGGTNVLKDLESICFKKTSTIPIPGFSIMGETTESNEGKRQVLLHIETMMSPEGMEAPGASNTKED